MVSSPVLSNLGLLRCDLPLRQGQRNLLALLVFTGLCAWSWRPLLNLFTLASENEHFSHLLLIPALTFCLLFLNRTAILTSRTWSPLGGLLIMAGGAVCDWFVDGQAWTQDRLAVAMLAFVVMCWGLFLFSFGVEQVRKNLFALMMLLFMVPFPAVIQDATIGFLQRGSAGSVEVLFLVLGFPVIRDGFIFNLSNLSIAVAEECSGIRSFLAMFITSLVAGYWFLKSWWARTALVAVVVPLAIIKNAFRIIGLALLANYVDPTYITNSALHRSGGIPLFLLSLVILVGVVWVLRQFERRSASVLTH